ncbi:ATP-grasp domain-containing protein [Paenibacillus sophorae]|uniref:ATP-grasp domain-containing protein n=1 Tax=Paenibacillus sophorae TaxID=1333845 RepID=A0A1H8UFE8_9BACL|nr:peptide ligase PGM1-related protein [Paenibacillus sophorae]QWU13147.1 ATP-grasp domain-containing protein [Paenibacillus sophorae]SEP01925.1 ATP-grasp domain-containing protein [Paenibacillus sophorae]
MNNGFSLPRLLTSGRHEGTIVWLCNIGAEQYWHQQTKGIADREEDRIVNRIEEMNLLLCRKQDVLILREQPDPAYLSELSRLGFDLPRIITVSAPDHHTPISELVLQDDAVLRTLRELADGSATVYFMPYAVTELEERIARTCGLTLVGTSSALSAIVNDKIFNRRMAEDLGLPVCEGIVCGSVEELPERYPMLKGAGSRIILKEPYAASGKGLYIVDTDEQFNALVARLSRFSSRRSQHPWIMERWLDKSADVNVQIYVGEDGAIDVFSIKRQILNGTVYIGSQLPAELEPEATDSYLEYGQTIGRYLHRLGYRGVAGIDSIIARDGVIIPVIEINGRFTLSTYISFAPHILGNKKVFSRYFRLLAGAPIDYLSMMTRLEDAGLRYGPECGSGVIIYTAGTLPNVSVGEDKRYMGRIFALVAADTWQEVHRLSDTLEKLIDGLPEKTDAVQYSLRKGSMI